MQMPFSVLLSIYNKENPNFLKQALDSVFNQSLPPLEVVLVKDGPLTQELDQVIEVYLQKYPILKIIVLEKNRGLGFALNEGLKYCSYDWVARMDTDDICFFNRFEEQFKIVKKYPEVSFIGSTVAEFVDNPDHVTSYRKLPEKNENIQVYAKKRCPLNHPTVLYRKQLILELGGYGIFPEDYHLWVRAIINGHKFYNIQEPLLYFRISSDTFKRRGGYKYLKIDLKHQKEFYQMGFISFSEYLYNCMNRIVVRSMPLALRQIIYRKILRS